MIDPISMASLLVRMALVIFFAAMAWNLYERRYCGMATLLLGMFFFTFRFVLLRVLAIHRYDYANSSAQIQQIGIWLQSPIVTIWAELVMLVGIVMMAKSFNGYFNNHGGKYGRRK